MSDIDAQPSKDGDLKSFHSMILKLDHGALNDLLTEKMKEGIREISDACHDRGGKHEAVLTLKLKFQMDQKDRVVEIYPDVDCKLPKAPLGRAGLYFANEKGEFLRENPRQLTLEDELERQRRQKMADAQNVSA